jgi:hypothetical protein
VSLEIITRSTSKQCLVRCSPNVQIYLPIIDHLVCQLVPRLEKYLIDATNGAWECTQGLNGRISLVSG